MTNIISEDIDESLLAQDPLVPIISKMRMNYSCIIEIKSKHFQFFRFHFHNFPLEYERHFLFGSTSYET